MTDAEYNDQEDDVQPPMPDPPDTVMEPDGCAPMLLLLLLLFWRMLT